MYVYIYILLPKDGEKKTITHKKTKQKIVELIVQLPDFSSFVCFTFVRSFILTKTKTIFYAVCQTIFRFPVIRQKNSIHFSF